MLICKICLTGGPCGGKTSALNFLSDELNQIGYKTIILNETATELINNKILKGNESDDDFAKMIVEYQLKKENAAIEQATKSETPYIIICDRSIIEPAAYIGKDKIKQFLDAYDLDFNKIINSYDLVLHITTVAKGAEHLYTLQNNTARTEDIKQAIDLDNKILRNMV